MINSTSVKDTFKRWSQDEDITPYERVIYQNTLSDALVSIRGVDTSIRQLNIYPLEGEGYGIGNYYGLFTAETETLPWYQSAKEKDGYRYVTTEQAGCSPVIQALVRTDCVYPCTVCIFDNTATLSVSWRCRNITMNCLQRYLSPHRRQHGYHCLRQRRGTDLSVSGRRYIRQL